MARLFLVRLILSDPEPIGDVRYYRLGLFGDDPTAMTEYPDAGVWPVRLLGQITGPDEMSFLIGFAVMMALLDAAFLGLLLIFGRERRLHAAWFWVVFGVAAGQVFWLRLDLFPGVLVGLFAALLFLRPTWAAAVLALATAVKLWPGVLAAGLVGGIRRTDTWLRVTVFFGTLAALVGVTWATSGLDRLLSPLTYQGDRGIQIESLAATPFLINAYRRPGEYSTGYASSKSFEITGPGTDVAATLADAAMVAVLILAVAWAGRNLVTGRWRPETTLAFSLLLVLLLIITNKVFSPQYIVWAGPLLAVALYATRSRLVPVMAVLTVVTAALGTWIYPFNYDPLWVDPATAATEITVLAVRNGLVVVLTLLATAWLVQESRRTYGPR
ncbi:DUF2029 domain-containing protein [Corynebacterium comes]|uniref:DUF2029 domain-containing protein n=1 Tax=Corynebacterium comes TaxID=2675218 RepID=UPI0012E1DBED|nr:DUF2029 domain-containing protein [Corynebacterium comes]